MALHTPRTNLGVLLSSSAGKHIYAGGLSFQTYTVRLLGLSFPLECGRLRAELLVPVSCSNQTAAPLSVGLLCLLVVRPFVQPCS